MKHCPECSEFLLAIGQNGMTVDVCRTCRGTWYDMGELARYQKANLWLVSVNEGDVPLLPERGTIAPCPGCGVPGFAVGDVQQHHAGRCAQCSGVWVALGKNDMTADGSMRMLRLALFLAAVS